MKKRKFNLLLQIATLCLCVAAIAFGVYSAKTASLNVSGTIGFEAHNCKVGVVAHLTGDGVVTNTESNIVASPDGNVRRTALEKVATFTNDANGTIDFGSLYFADMDTINGKAAPIKMTFTITNNSAFAIKASVTLPKNNNDVTVLADKDSIKIEQGTNKTGEITLTFTLNNPEASLATALDLSTIKFDFTKFEFKKSDIEVKYTDTALSAYAGLLSNYYIKYGQGTVNTTPNVTKYDINWFVIGTYGTDGQIKTLTPATDFTKTLSTNGETGKILKDDVTYAFMSDYILTSGGGTTDGVPFNNNVFKNSTGEYYSNEYTSVLANDYSISTVRAYLNGKTVNTTTSYNGTDIHKSTKWTPSTDTTTNLNFFTQNTLKGDNATSDIYTLIQPRTLGDMYKKMSGSSTDLALPTAVEGISETDADAFWLLSYNEAIALCSTSGFDDYNKIVGNTLTPKTDDTSSCSASADEWSFRSPYSSNSEYAYGITIHADITGAYVYVIYCGVRPAFLI
ncbi:MAG: DUF6273 domain-containing protein [Clostridia bacterium]|nr:DUF6273 domain-containing protein [Clostridia bacterium]